MVARHGMMLSLVAVILIVEMNISLREEKSQKVA